MEIQGHPRSSILTDIEIAYRPTTTIDHQ